MISLPSSDHNAEHWLKSLPNLKHIMVVITGATDGIGKAAALAMARKQASLIIIARSCVKAQALIECCLQANPGGNFRYVHCDLADFSSCEDAIARIMRMHVPLDVIVANAGGAFDYSTTNSQNLNKTFFVNHTGHFALVTALLPLLKKTRDSRIIMQSSVAHYAASGNFDLYFNPQTRALKSAYADSKLANLLFARSLRRHAKLTGAVYRAIASHPGYLVTNINKHTVLSGFAQSAKALVKGNYNPLLLNIGYHFGLMQPSSLSAALPLLYAAFTEHSYDYIGPQSLFGLRGTPGYSRMSEMACSDALSHALWNRSLSWCRANAKSPDLWRQLSRHFAHCET